MGCHIAYDGDNDIAIMYCSTTDRAFGPVFGKDDDHDARERVEAFFRWMDQTDTWHGYEKAYSVRAIDRDPRQLTDAGLESAYSDWCAQEADQWKREEAAELAAAEDLN